jgi:hypothetical protein
MNILKIINKRIIAFVLFILLTTAYIQGQAQSFFIPGGSYIKNTGAYGVTRGFCLEYNQPVIGDNVIDLVNYFGSVTINYKDKTTKTVSLASLVNKSDGFLNKPIIELKGLGTYGALGIKFNDNNIESITINDDGVILYRTDNDFDSLQKNQMRIQGYLDKETPFFQAQFEGWQSLFDSYEFKDNLFDFGTSEENKLFMRYTNSAHISGTINDKPIIDIDKLEYSQQNGILIYSHLHDDHIKANVLEQTLNEGNYRFIVVPKIADSIQNNKALNVIRNHIAKEKPYYEDDEIIIIAPNDNKEILHVSKLNFGNFNYYKFEAHEDILIEIYKQKGQTDMNKSSLITKINHKSINYLSFGDYNNIDGINELIDLSKKNEEQYLMIREEIDKKFFELFKIISEVEYRYRNLSNIETTNENDIKYFINLFYEILGVSVNTGMEIKDLNFIQNNVINDKAKHFIYKEDYYYIYNLMTKIIQIINNSKGANLSGEEIYMQEFKDLLDNVFHLSKLIGQYRLELANHPFLRTNVFKWFHHEAGFDIKKEKEIIDTVKEFNKIIRPNFIMHEKGRNQKNYDLIFRDLPELQEKNHSTENEDKLFHSKLKNKEKVAA